MTVKLSVDGITDYSNIVIGFDENMYAAAGGENYYFQDGTITVSE